MTHQPGAPLSAGTARQITIYNIFSPSKCGCGKNLTAASGLQVLFDLLNHFLIFTLAELHLAGVHGKGGTPFKCIPVFGHQVEMQVAAAVAVGTVVDLIRMESLVNSPGGSGNVRHKRVPLLFADVHQLADVVLIGYNDPAGVALLLEENQLAHVQVADFDAEARQNFTAYAVAAVAVFHFHSSFL